MDHDLSALRQVFKMSDDEQLAESFAMYIEARIDLETPEGFLRTVSQLPVSMRHAYLPWHADIEISRGGLGQLLHSYNTPEVRAQVIDGLYAIGESDLAVLYLEAWSHEEVARNLEASDINANTGNFHKRYFARNKNLGEAAGRYLRSRRKVILAACS